MDKKTDQLKAELAKTKADLKEKASEFETRLREDVTNAKDTVEGAIHNVQSIAAGLSLKKLAQKRPMLVLGGSVVSGMVVGHILAPKSRVNVNNSIPSHTGPSLAGRIHDQFPDEVRILKTMAFTYLVNLMADKAKSAFPEFVQKITDFEEKVTTKLGHKV